MVKYLVSASVNPNKTRHLKSSRNVEGVMKLSNYIPSGICTEPSIMLEHFE